MATSPHREAVVDGSTSTVLSDYTAGIVFTMIGIALFLKHNRKSQADINDRKYMLTFYVFSYGIVSIVGGIYHQICADKTVYSNVSPMVVTVRVLGVFIFGFVATFLSIIAQPIWFIFDIQYDNKKSWRIWICILITLNMMTIAMTLLLPSTVPPFAFLCIAFSLLIISSVIDGIKHRKHYLEIIWLYIVALIARVITVIVYAHFWTICILETAQCPFNGVFSWWSFVHVMEATIAMLTIAAVLYQVNCTESRQYYSAVDQNTSTDMSDMNTEYESDSDTNHAMNDYDAVLSQSIKSVKLYFVTGIIYSFFRSNRMSIYILYAQEFNPNPFALSILLYAFNFWNGIAALIYSSLGNQFGYDFIINILLFIQCVGVALEAIAFKFWMLSAAVIIAQVSITHVVIAYIAWILPLKYSTKYISYFYAIFVSSYLLGPAMSGFVSYYISNRMVFIINTFITVLCLIYSMLLIRSTQMNLEQKQLNITYSNDEPSDDLQFPVYLEKDRNDAQVKWYSLPPNVAISTYITLLCIIYINCCVTLAENAILLFYALYAIHEFKSTVYEGTLGIVPMSITFIVGNLFLQKLFEKYKVTKVRTAIWINISLIIAVLILSYGFRFITSFTIYWIYAMSTGLPLGCLSMASEIVILMIQPTKYSGKVSGVKGLLRNWSKAVSALVINLWWHYQHKSWIYTCCIAWIGALLSAIVMLFTAKRNNQ